MKRFTFGFLLMLLFMPPTSLSAQTISSVAAVVNADIITTYQLDRAVETLLSRQKQRSKELGLSVTTQEIDDAVDDVMTSNNLDPAALETALAAEGMTLESYRRQIRDEILRYKLMSQEVNYRAQVTSSEVRRYFEENIDESSRKKSPTSA